MKFKTEIFELRMYIGKDTEGNPDYQPMSLHSTYESAREKEKKLGASPLDSEIIRYKVYLSETEKEKVLDKYYFDLSFIKGQTILESREYVLHNDTFNVATIYRDIEIHPDRWYLASIVWDDISPITSHYIEEVIIEPIPIIDWNLIN